MSHGVVFKRFEQINFFSEHLLLDQNNISNELSRELMAQCCLLPSKFLALATLELFRTLSNILQIFFYLKSLPRASIDKKSEEPPTAAEQVRAMSDLTENAS